MRSKASERPAEHQPVEGQPVEVDDDFKRDSRCYPQRFHDAVG
jgi:hypothetical protein